MRNHAAVAAAAAGSCLAVEDPVGTALAAATPLTDENLLQGLLLPRNNDQPALIPARALKHN